MNLLDSMNAVKRPKGASVCVVCGEPARLKAAHPGWIMNLIAGAQAFGLTIKRPDGAKVHDKCRDALQILIDRKTK